ncbi:hypothetical protein [Aquimarina megaterium]|uniref:hypothetical protein n=1 Tax=Aquimarina megaterium TaxID=1443666 RepID=UPI00046F37FA|nr:hypothetical protein [Aquimarina megaterium]
MKNLKKKKMVAIGLALCIGFTVLAKDKEFKVRTMTSDKIENNIKEANILLKAGKVIEIAYATVEGGKEAHLNKEYFSKILPIAAKYEGKMLGSLQVTAVVGGEVVPQMVAIFEWPNIEARDKLLADRKAQKLFPVRDAILTSIKLAYYTVDKDVMITFREDKTYEFFNAWLTPEAEKLLPEYFKKSDDVKKKYGSPAFLANLKPLKGLSTADYLLQPHMAGIVEWNNTNAYYGLIADPEFKKVAPLLVKSLTRIDGIHAKFNFPQ